MLSSITECDFRVFIFRMHEITHCDRVSIIESVMRQTINEKTKMYNIEMKKKIQNLRTHSYYFIPFTISVITDFNAIFFLSLYISTLWQSQLNIDTNVMTNTMRKAKATVSNTQTDTWTPCSTFRIVSPMAFFFYQFVVSFVYSLLKTADKTEPNLKLLQTDRSF